MAIKKTDKKAEKKVVKKPTPRKLKLEDAVIDVPQGGQVIGVLELSPMPPSGGTHGDWALVNTETSNQLSDDIWVGFSKKSSSIQSELERAVLVINIVDSEPEKGRWRFALQGIDVCKDEGNLPYSLESEILNYGKTLVLYIHAGHLGEQKINFSFIAAYTDAKTGVATIYESKDPGIFIGRPRSGP